MIDLGGIRLDDSNLCNQLRQDIRDDWFPDPLRYKDCLQNEQLTKTIVRIFEENHGEFIPNLRTVENVPKPDFTIRAALETGIADRAVYHLIASYLCEWFDPLIPWFAFSHRRNTGKHDNRYMFRRGVDAWMDFLGNVRAALEPGLVLLSTDLTNYFDNINISKLRNEMIELIPQVSAEATEKNRIRNHLMLLFDCMNHWSYEKGRGLPQNRDASSFLANVYMRRVDIKMREAGHLYFRYMDDIKVVCSDQNCARRALKDLIVELRQLGLAVNSKKTKIIPISSRDDISESIEEASPELRHIESMWKTRRSSQIKQSFVPLRRLAISCIRNRCLNSREFRFCIKRLTLLAGCSEFSTPPEYFEEITELMILAIDDNPSSTDQMIAYFERVPLSDEQMRQIIKVVFDPEKRIYDWQTYRFWLLFGTLKANDDQLKVIARQQIHELPDCPARAGATLFLGAFGDQKDRDQIAEGFPQLSSFIGQRAAIVALQEVPFDPRIKDYVVKSVRPDIKGSYRVLRGSPVKYFADPERISVTQIIDVDRDYA